MTDINWKRPLRELHLLLLLAAVPAVLAAWLHPAAPEWNWREEEPPEGYVTMATLPAPVEEITWIDARSRGDFEAGHVPGAILLNEDEWEGLFFEAIDDLAEPQPIVVYCSGGGCRASQGVAERLRQDLGRDDIYVLQGGWDAWRERG